MISKERNRFIFGQTGIGMAPVGCSCILAFLHKLGNYLSLFMSDMAISIRISVYSELWSPYIAIQYNDNYFMNGTSNGPPFLQKCARTARRRHSSGAQAGGGALQN